MAAPPAIASALEALSRALVASGAPYAIVGGVAAIVHGIPRHTNDVDVTVMGGGVALDPLLGHLADAGIRPRIDDALAFASENQVLLLVHEPSGTPIDLSLGWLPFEEEAIRTATWVQIEASKVPVIRPEHLVIYKAIAWRDRDQEDVRRIVEQHDADLPWDRIRAVVAELSAAMDLPDRVDALDALRARATAG